MAVSKPRKYPNSEQWKYEIRLQLLVTGIPASAIFWAWKIKKIKLREIIKKCKLSIPELFYKHHISWQNIEVSQAWLYLLGLTWKNVLNCELMEIPIFLEVRAWEHFWKWKKIKQLISRFFFFCESKFIIFSHCSFTNLAMWPPKCNFLAIAPTGLSAGLVAT